MSTLFETSGATFSACRLYRYTLERCWGDGLRCNFIMLNPSTADETKNDPTVERCQRRAVAWGYGGLVVTNLFAYRGTDPGTLRQVEDPIGPESDEAIVEAARVSSLVVCAWGTHGSYLNRSRQVRELLKDVPLFCLRQAKGGEPCHPLYLPYTLEPVPWRPS